MTTKFSVPEFLPLLENIKAVFSEDLTPQQKSSYQCLVAWALKMPLLQLQLAGNNLSQELKNGLIELLAPVQNSLVEIDLSMPERVLFIKRLTETIDNLYLDFAALPEGRPKEDIIEEWQGTHGQGFISPAIPLPQPSDWRHSGSPMENRIFDVDENIPWQYSDTPNTGFANNERHASKPTNNRSKKENRA